MLVNKTKKYVHSRFTSVSEIKNFRRSGAGKKANQSHKDYTDPNYANKIEWLGAESVTAFNEIFKDGYKEGVKLISEMKRELKVPAILSARRRRVRRDQGDFLDIHSVYNGNLSRAWERTERVSKNAPSQITLIHNMSTAWTEDNSTYRWRGITMLTIASALEEAGHSVEIIGLGHNKGSFSSDKKRKQIIEFPIKEFGTPVNLNSLATTAAFVGFYRTHMFEAKTSAGLKLQDSLGSPIHETPDLIKSKSPITMDGFDRISSREDAQEYIDKHLSQFT